MTGLYTGNLPHLVRPTCLKLVKLSPLKKKSDKFSLKVFISKIKECQVTRAPTCPVLPYSINDELCTGANLIREKGRGGGMEDDLPYGRQMRVYHKVTFYHGLPFAGCL
ncbi:hypothetical protein OUZ56_012139 [Daphnia magna]|uniref:Uncharacterized protein n=1 Tax=Daphnia magna TaxID=35525 RepID=A0ABQ9Z3H0_9CRUS|nr:hypothetical protein OUZ56_012139 [Daphnia magna]